MSDSLALPAPDTGAGFQHWWNAPGEWVEPPNIRRAGESGVQRLRGADRTLLYSKRQTGHLYRSLLHPFGRPTVLREKEALQAVARLGVRVPRIVYCAAQKKQGQWQALLVTEALDGFVSLEQWYAGDARQRWGEKIHRQMLRQVGITLSRLHRGRWQHGCCYPKHVFVKVQGAGDWAWVDIALLDLEKSRRRWTMGAASQHDIKQLHRHRGDMPEADWQLLRAAYDQALADPAGATRQVF